MCMMLPFAKERRSVLFRPPNINPCHVHMARSLVLLPVIAPLFIQLLLYRQHAMQVLLFSCSGMYEMPTGTSVDRN